MLTGQANSGAEAASDGLSGSSFKLTCEYGRISLRIFYPRYVAGGRSQAKGTFKSPERSYYGGFRFDRPCPSKRDPEGPLFSGS
jgi:hypothetical protein